MSSCPYPLTDALEDARRRGLACLEATLRADGAWPSLLVNAAGKESEEFPPFTAALGHLALESCELPEAAKLRFRTKGYIERICEFPGIWRYWDSLPPDLDDTAVCSLVCASHIWVALGLNVEGILGIRDSQGRFRTWMVSRPDIEAEWNAADPVVNANVIAYLGDHAGTRQAQHWLERLIMNERETEALVYYPETMDLYVAMARTARSAPPVFRALRPTLRARITAYLASRSDLFDLTRLAQGVCALNMLGESVETAILEEAAHRFLGEQSSGGGWPCSNLWRRAPEFPVVFRSVALSTAYCIAAIGHILRR